MSQSNQVPELNTYYNHDDFYWDYWCFEMYTEEVYREVMKNYWKAEPPPELIESQKKYLEPKHQEKLEREKSISNQTFHTGKFGELPKNFQLRSPVKGNGWRF